MKTKKKRNNLIERFLLTLPPDQRAEKIRYIASKLNICTGYVRAMRCGIKPIQPWMLPLLPSVTNWMIKLSKESFGSKRATSNKKQKNYK
jgi:hypothetical protein